MGRNRKQVSGSVESLTRLPYHPASQEREFERVGDTKTIQVNTRVIAASNRELLDEIELGNFREDLYYRLNVVSIELPPLRERREDIPELGSYFLVNYNEVNDRYVTHIAREAMLAMEEYQWPGNVRELQNYIERAVVLADQDELSLDLLPDNLRFGHRTPLKRGRGGNLETLSYEVVQEGLATANNDEDNLYTKIVTRVERELIAQVMADCDHVQIKAAGRLGINRNTLHKKLKEYNLER